MERERKGEAEVGGAARVFGDGLPPKGRLIYNTHTHAHIQSHSARDTRTDTHTGAGTQRDRDAYAVYSQQLLCHKQTRTHPYSHTRTHTDAHTQTYTHRLSKRQRQAQRALICWAVARDVSQTCSMQRGLMQRIKRTAYPFPTAEAAAVATEATAAADSAATIFAQKS